jgi:hypothetical protein
MKNLCFLLTYIIFCACNLGSVHSDKSASPNAVPDKDPSADNAQKYNLTKREFYFGVSNSESGRLAWVIDLGPEGGTLYMPPDNLHIERPSVSDKGNLIFETEKGLGGIIYKFSGQFEKGKIVGEFTYYGFNSVPERAPVSLEKIPKQNTQSNIEGLYSNVKFVKETGDLIGEAVVLIPSEHGIVGVFTSYDNEMVPFAFYPKEIGKQVEFDIETENRTQSFKGFLSTKEMRIRRSDSGVDKRTGLTVLPKKKELSDFLQNLR